MCISYHCVNKLIITFCYPLPYNDNPIDRLYGAWYISKTNCELTPMK